MPANKDDFELHIKSKDIPTDLGHGLSSISIFNGNIALRFPAEDNDRDSRESHNRRGAIMPSLHSLPSPTNTSYLSHVDSSNLEQSEKKIKFVPDYEAGEPIFWRVFEELANNGNGFVAYDRLQEGLVSTAKFFVGEAVLMIEHMEKIGKIEKTEQYHVYRRGNFASPN